MAETTNLWHIDGIAYGEEPVKELGKVYRNGELAKTNGKWEMITIVIN